LITCQACGTQNPPSATFCSKCARKLDAATQQAIVQERAEYSAGTGINWTSVLIAALVTILLVAVVLFVVVHGI
jgi:uncharacterized membrane protein YvbJ